MPSQNPKIQELVNQFIGSGLIDSINEKQDILDKLSEKEQKSLAENIVIKWVENRFEPKDLFRIKHQVPLPNHNSKFAKFNDFLIEAVNLYAAFYGLCDRHTPKPEFFILEIEKNYDELNGMLELKNCLFREVLNPNTDQIVAKISNKEQRANLSKLFRSERSIASKINSANEAKDLIEKLKSNTPWKMFIERGFNVNLFLAHHELVRLMISENQAIEIGQKLQHTPKELKALVTSKIQSLVEAFKKSNRIDNNKNSFTIIRNSMAKTSDNAFLITMGKLKQCLFFRPKPSVPSNTDSVPELR